MPQFTYLEAIRQGIWEEMERDPSVFCLGEDIGIYGGAFKVTEGFIDRFGPERVIDTPIAESAIVGAAFGASLTVCDPSLNSSSWISSAALSTRSLIWLPNRIIVGTPQRLSSFADRAAATSTVARFTHKTLKCGSCTHPDSRWFARRRLTMRKA